ncbi:MAG: EFR1 family ferrodoxin [Endomicrobiaceae bacterium]|nr:EFR1 family ferrodoxin [Endomicrobiaceae bacterium]
MKVNKSDIYVFSGTGNTLSIAKKIAEVFNSKNVLTKVHRIEATDPKNIELSSTIGIGFTVACWNTYPMVKKWLKALPVSNGTEVFLFDSMGDSSFKMIASIAKQLENKGYKIIGSKEFKMPNNFLLVEKEEKKLKKLNITMPLVEKFAEDIIAGKADAVKGGFIYCLFFSFTSLVVNTWNWKLSQKMITFKIDKQLCTKCGLCADICPKNNITMNEFPVFNNKCEICLRCISYCPVKAISSKLLYKNRTHRGIPTGEIKWRNPI